jgi:hypothetical protein
MLLSAAMALNETITAAVDKGKGAAADVLANLTGRLNDALDGNVANTASNATNATVDATSNVTAAANSTLSKAAGQAAELLPATQSFFPLIFIRLWDLLAAPFRHGEMFWIIIPLFFTLIVMEFYYDRHDDEELGWGATVANSLVLIFVAIDLVKESFGRQTPWTVGKSVVLAFFSDGALPVSFQVVLLIGFLGALGLVLTLISYFHLMPRKIMFNIAGHPPVNFLAYFAIAIVYSTNSSHPIPLDLATCVAGVLLFLIILFVVFGLKRTARRMTGDRKGWD